MIKLNSPGGLVELELPEGDHIRRIIERHNDWYERAMLDDIYNRKPAGIALDIGACFGTHSAWFSRACQLKVYAFEPNPKALPYLRRNIERNHLNVAVIEAAASDRSGGISMSRPIVADNMGSTRVIARRQSEVPIPMIKVDSLNLNDVGLMKIDVEGMELRVLLGAAETIRRCHPIIYVESQHKTFSQVQRFLQDLGYVLQGKFNPSSPTYCFASDYQGASIVAPEVVGPQSLSTVIMAHPKREQFMPYLASKLGDVPIIWDEHNDRWDTGRRAMLAYDRDATHHLVIQDDALVCDDFLPAVERAIQMVPHNPISLYTGRTRPNHDYVAYMVERAREADASWFSMEGPWWGVAIVVPTFFIERMITWADRQTRIANYDKRLSRFFYNEGVGCYYSVPSLVSHRTGHENPSLVPGRGSGSERIAFDFIGEDVSANEVEWTSRIVYPGLSTPRKVTP